jgi:hypothetical protein
MLKDAGTCLRELVLPFTGAAEPSRVAFRKLDVIELVRQQRNDGVQEVAFGARPFILCGLPIRRLPTGRAPVFPP